MSSGEGGSALPRREAPVWRFTNRRAYVRSLRFATYSLFGVQLHSTLSIVQPSSPHTVAEATLTSSLPVGSETFADDS